MAKRGPKFTYTEELAAEICRRLKAGETLRAICRTDGMPAPPTVIQWSKDDIGPGFGERYARAREIGYHLMAEELLEIADDGTNDWVQREGANGTAETVLDHEHVTRSRLRVDTRKWLLAKALPKIYADKLLHTGGDGVGPIKHTLTLDYDALDEDELLTFRRLLDKMSGGASGAVPLTIEGKPEENGNE